MNTNETGWSDPKETKAKNLAPYSNNTVACMYWAEGYLKGIEQLAAKDAEIERLKSIVRKAHDSGYVSGYEIGKVGEMPRFNSAWETFKTENNL